MQNEGYEYVYSPTIWHIFFTSARWILGRILKSNLVRIGNVRFCGLEKRSMNSEVDLALIFRDDVCAYGVRKDVVDARRRQAVKRCIVCAPRRTAIFRL
jgi:hypothetical protein